VWDCSTLTDPPRIENESGGRHRGRRVADDNVHAVSLSRSRPDEGELARRARHQEKVVLFCWILVGGVALGSWIYSVEVEVKAYLRSLVAISTINSDRRERSPSDCDNRHRPSPYASGSDASAC
jgi:hypothetical protein